MPIRQALVGAAVFHTWLVADSGAPGNPLGVVTTAAVASVLGY